MELDAGPSETKQSVEGIVPKSRFTRFALIHSQTTDLCTLPPFHPSSRYSPVAPDSPDAREEVLDGTSGMSCFRTRLSFFFGFGAERRSDLDESNEREEGEGRTVDVLRDIKPSQEHDGLLAAIATDCWIWRRVQKSRTASEKKAKR
jgi:hypothetical protein